MSNLEKYIAEFAKNNCDGELNKGNYFTIIDGTSKIMFSAPHAVNHYRDGSVKWADINTGVIVKALHDICDVPIIYTNAFAEGDAMIDEVSEYKEVLACYVRQHSIKALIDVHGRALSSPLGIEFGTRDDDNSLLLGKDFILDSFWKSFDKHLELQGKVIDRNIKFRARTPGTVGNYIWRTCNIPCMQIEINKLFRDPEALQITIDAMVQAVNCIEASKDFT